MTTAGAAVVPPSPPALMPSGLVGESTSAISVANGGMVSARGLLGEFEKIEGAVGLARAESAVAELNMLRHRSQDRGGDSLALRDEVGQRLREQGRSMAHGAARMRAAAHLHHVGVAEDDSH